MRLFVAVNLPDDVRHATYEATAPVRNAVADVRWTPAESLHVTLKFLGEVHEARCEAIAAALHAAGRAHAPFPMRLDALDAFPSRARPHIWILHVEDDGGLGRLHHDVDARLEQLGFERDERPFVPHVTIGRTRARRGSTPAQPPALPRVNAGSEIRVESVDLMKSQTDPRGARYERLAAAPLAGSN